MNTKDKILEKVNNTLYTRKACIVFLLIVCFPLFCLWNTLLGSERSKDLKVIRGKNS